MPQNFVLGRYYHLHMTPFVLGLSLGALIGLSVFAWKGGIDLRHMIYIPLIATGYFCPIRIGRPLDSNFVGITDF